MKERLLNWIVCPACKNKLNLAIDEVKDGEIKGGVLSCKCGNSYKITNYIPRFVSADDYAGSFSFEWKLHRTTQLDNETSKESEETFKLKTGIALSNWKGKIILDVGCGSGRFMDVVERHGGEVVGCDLSFAVDAAFETMGLRENIHIIQADIFNLPFKDETFDIVFSIGVLHHTPNCELAFKQLPKLLKNGGQISIWVYSNYNVVYVAASNFWRRITTKMPKKLLYYFSYLSIPFYHIKKIPIVGGPLKILFPTEMHKNWRWRVLDTFDWYSPKYQSKHTYPEVFRWFEEERLSKIRVLENPVSMTGYKNQTESPPSKD